MSFCLGKLQHQAAFERLRFLSASFKTKKHLSCVRHTRSRLLLTVILALISLGYSSPLWAQYDFLPKVGIKEFANYQHTDIDSVDLDSGNLNVHIPLIAFPQKGGKLRLNFMIRYNEPQWSFSSAPPQSNGNGLITSGNWAITNNQGFTPRPLGVDVVRDQGITETQTLTSRHAVSLGGEDTQYTSYTYGVRDRTGAEHLVGTDPGLGGGTTTWALSPDGSGWLPIYTLAGAGTTYIITGYHDKDGLTYTSYHPTGLPGNLPAWNIQDAHGNTITTAADGWHDSVGRLIPGSWTGYGSGSINDPGQQLGPIDTDPFPGIPSNETGRCSNGAIGTRTWTVPASNDSGGSETYYFCYSQFHANTHFNFTGPLGGIQIGYADEASFSAVLLTQIILPNNTSYSFQYDPDFLELTRIDIPTGGYISYVWNSITWDICSTALPMKRVVTQRTVHSGGGSPDSVWSFKWQSGALCDPEPGTAPGVIVTHPDGNDEWHPAKSGANPNNQPLNDLISDVYYYKGLTNGDPSNATGILLKKVETTSRSKESIFYMSNPESAVTDPATGNVNWQPGNSIREYFPGPVEKTVTTLYDPNTQQIQSSQETDTLSLPSAGALDRWNPDYYAYPNNGHDICACLNYSEIKTTKVYDVVQGAGAGPGALLRRTETSFRFQDTGGSSYSDKGLTGLPSQVQTYDGSNNLMAQTRYTYDDAAHSSGAIAGELTSVRAWKDATTYYDTFTNFNGEGTWIGAVDARNVETHANTFDCSNTFPSSVTKAYGTSVAETFVYSHDCNTGKVVTYTDPNAQSTTYNYADPLSRIKAVSYPDGGHTGISYVDGANSSTTITVDTNGPQGQMSQTVRYDLVGRTTQIQQNAGSDVISVDTHYDAMGHVYSTSNPYTSSQGSSSDVTLNTYDELERLIRKTNPDSTYQALNYSGNIITTTDEAGNSWQRTTDGLGRLTKVVEPNGATTNYTYTARGDLGSVNQVGLTGNVARNRSFSYDWLSRLSQSYNPESGWICYGTTSSGAANGSNCTPDYDGNGNLGHKTDARGVVISYNYDSLNRLISKGYLGGSNPTPASCYSYDTGFGAGTNPIGKLTGEWTQSGGCSFGSQDIPSTAMSWKKGMSYDAMGRLKDELQCPVAPCATPSPMHYDYDVAGNTIHQANGLANSQSPQVGWTSSFDNAGRLSKIVSDWSSPGHPATLFKADQTVNNAYGPFGLTAAQYGIDESSPNPALTESQTFDNRGRLTNRSFMGANTSTPSFSVTLNSYQVHKGGTVWFTVTTGCSTSCGGGSYLVDGNYIGGFTVPNGGTLQNAVSTTQMAYGTHTITVNWSNATSPQTVSFQVNGPDLPVVNPTISISTDPVLYKQITTVTAGIGYTDGSGGVSWFLDGTTFLGGGTYSPSNNGVFTYQLQTPLSQHPSIPVGSHTLTLSLTGDANHPAGSTTVPFTVVPDLSISVVPSTFQQGGTPTIVLTTHCMSSCSGGVVYLDGVYTNGFTMPNGGTLSWQQVTTGIPAGSHTIGVQIDQLGGRVTVPYTITNPPLPVIQPTLSISPQSPSAGQTVTLTAHVGYTDGPKSGGMFFLDNNYVGGFTYNASVNEQLTFSLPNLSSGAHTARVELGGTPTHPAASQTISFNVQ